MEYTTYNFDNFNYTDILITIKPNTLFYRGIRDLKAIKNFDILRKDVPIYLASKESAKKYSDDNDSNIFSISVNEYIKIIDIRKIQHILQIVLDSYIYKKNDTEFKTHMEIFSLALGLVDYKTQVIEFDRIAREQKWIEDPNISNGINRMKQFFNDKINTYKMARGPLTKLGFRIALTDVDALVVLFLKELFGDYCDGYIAPKMFSPLQPEFYINEELVLFDTKKLVVVDSSIIPKKKDIDILLYNFENILVNFKYQDKLNFKMFMQKGGSRDTRLLSLGRDKNEDFYDEKKMKKNNRLVKRLAKKLIKNRVINDYDSDDIQRKLELRESNYPAFKLNVPLNLKSL